MKNTYSLIDSGAFKKLESVGPFRIVRPSPSAVWAQTISAHQWKDIDAEFIRYPDGNGEWKVTNSKIKEPWEVEFGDVKFKLKLTGFGHLGLFAEQEKNWREVRNLIQEARPTMENFRVLNLFAYTGGTTLFSAKAGAEVVHLDASKTSVAWARENAETSGLKDKPIRWLVDDVQDFVNKEIRREKKYEGIVLDPPSYGRGVKNQVWKIEDHLMGLLNNLNQLASEQFRFILLSSHSPGYTPVSLENQLRQIFSKKWPKFELSSGEMTIVDSVGNALPSGAYSFFKVNP